MSTFSDIFAINLSRISLSKVNVEMYQQTDRERRHVVKNELYAGSIWLVIGTGGGHLWMR